MPAATSTVGHAADPVRNTTQCPVTNRTPGPESILLPPRRRTANAPSAPSSRVPGELEARNSTRRQLAAVPSKASRTATRNPAGAGQASVTQIAAAACAATAHAASVHDPSSGSRRGVAGFKQG